MQQAANAKEKTDESEEKEGVELAVASSMIDEPESLKITKENIDKALKQQFGTNADYVITENGDGSFTLKFNTSKRTYYIEETGNIIEYNNILEISNAAELKDFRDKVNNGDTFEGKIVLLTNNITLNISEEWVPIGYYSMESTSPNSELNKPFKGIFEGNGHVIDGIFINTTNKVQGLFGLINNGKINNLGIGENCNIKGGVGTAGIVGYAYNNSIVNNCYNLSRITGNANNVGGISGIVASNSIIKKCYNSGTITGTANVRWDRRICNIL